jgi:hypothetical protein
MTSQGPSSLGGVIAVIAGDDEPRPPRTPQSQLDAWAATLASTLAQQMPPPRAIPPPATTEAWRPSVGALTPGSEATLGGSNPTPTGAAPGSADDSEQTPSTERVHLSTQIADLGEVNLVVDRTNGGVRVLIGVEDARAAMLIDPERLRLQGALLAAGVGVESIRVVQVDRRGTLLASARGSVSRTPQHPADPRVDDIASKKRSRGHKVNLVG